MKQLIKTVLLSATLIACGTSAIAQPDRNFELRLGYNHAAPTAKIYKQVKKKVARECRRFYRQSPQTLRKELIDTCASELTKRALTAIGLKPLTSYHAKQMQREPTNRQFSENQQ